MGERRFAEQYGIDIRGLVVALNELYGRARPIKIGVSHSYGEGTTALASFE
jgi:hypothetical protein